MKRRLNDCVLGATFLASHGGELVRYTLILRDLPNTLRKGAV